MAIKKFLNQTPDKDLGKSKSDNALAKLGHLNRLVDDLNNAGPDDYSLYFPQSGVDLRTVGPRVYFEKKDGEHAVDIVIPGVLEITRGVNGGIYNRVFQSGYSGNGPTNTEWNSYFGYKSIIPAPVHWAYGWNNLLGVNDREFVHWNYAMGYSWPPRAVNYELIMRETTTGRIWLVKFLKWSMGIYGGKGGFAYERYEVFPKTVFTRPAFSPLVMDHISDGLVIKRDNRKGIYNTVLEDFYDDNAVVSPKGSLWNSGYVDNPPTFFGWDNLGNLRNRNFDFWNVAAGNNPVNSIGDEMVMKDLSTGLYWMIKFTDWGVGSQGGGGSFAYERTLIPMDKTVEFADKSIIDSAYSIPAGTLPSFETHAAAQLHFVTANGFIMGRGNYYINSTTNAVSYCETSVYNP